MNQRARTPGYPVRVVHDDDREVDFDDELTILPDQTRDDTDEGWGEQPRDNDEQLLANRPPHWE